MNGFSVLNFFEIKLSISQESWWQNFLSIFNCGLLLICIITHKLELVDLVAHRLLHFGKCSLLIPKIGTRKFLHVFTKTTSGFKVLRMQRSFLDKFRHHLRFMNIINIQNLTLLTPLLIMLTLLTSTLLMLTLITFKIILMIE